MSAIFFDKGAAKNTVFNIKVFHTKVFHTIEGLLFRNGWAY